MSEQTPTSILQEFKIIIINKINNQDDVSEKTVSLTNFSPETINLLDMPTESGTFKVTLNNSNLPIFASGKYSVTNCIINEDDEIVEETYEWNATTESTCGLVVLNVEISDNTACDYYYIPSDFYTPISQIPNKEITSYSVTVNFPTVLASIQYFNMLAQTQPQFITGLFFVTLSQDESKNDVCALNKMFVRSFVINSGDSLSELQNIPQGDKTTAQINKGTFFNWTESTTKIMLYSQSIDTTLNLQSGGLIETIIIDGEEYGIYLARANFSPDLENSNGQINLLLALVRQSDNAPYDRYLFPNI